MQAQVAEINSKATALEKQLEEGKARESQMRAHNKVRSCIAAELRSIFWSGA